MNAEIGGPLVCPKPRRMGPISGAHDPIRSLRLKSWHQVDPSDLQAGVELLDIFLTRGGEHPVDSTPPFFCGSPPARSGNPVVHDARFGEVAPVNGLGPLPSPMPAPASARTGCARAKFGFAPAAVRIEGFDCLDGSRNRSRGIRAFA